MTSGIHIQELHTGTVELAGAIRPDVVLMDIGMPSMDGVSATGTTKQALLEVRVIMLTSHDSEEDICAALRTGADGYCVKTVGVSLLVTAIAYVAGGAAWIDSAIAARVLSRASGVPQASAEPGGGRGSSLFPPTSSRFCG